MAVHDNKIHTCSNKSCFLSDYSNFQVGLILAIFIHIQLSRQQENNKLKHQPNNKKHNFGGPEAEGPGSTS